LTRTKQRGVPALGERMTSLIEASGLNASELSARTGISVSYLTRIIQGEVVNPTIDFVIRIAAGLGVTESELLRRPALRRRRGGALASDPIEEPPPDSQAVEVRTVGQDIDEVLDDLSQEERDRLRGILVPLTRQLVHLAKLNTGE
jgi:transcriptional regulator with XRE-family HTH domain